MPRRPRFSTGGFVFHVLNRAAGRRAIFSDESDYIAFEGILNAAAKRVPMRLLSYCLMPNHWHLVLWPQGDDDLSEYMRWLTLTHTQRWHLAHDMVGTGPLYQGRFKSFPVESDHHFFVVSRYVERNALRAGLVTRAEDWRWSSLWQVTNACADVVCDSWPLPRPGAWLEYVNAPQTESELNALRRSVARGTPYGSAGWRAATAKQLGLEGTLLR